MKIIKKVILIVLLNLVGLSVYSQQVGIVFFKGTYEEAIVKAKTEKKQIFIDFYTEWCGPCLNMAEDVFTLPIVGMIYNKNFISLKVDAEKGEGRKLATKFNVNKYPTYIFIDPKTEAIVHRSGGNKPEKDFLADANAALTPKKGSIYLDKIYNKGKYDNDFLIEYIQMKKITGNRDITSKLFDELIGRGAKLTDTKVWNVYVDCIPGYDNPYFKTVSDNYDVFVKLYGKKAVDSKLSDATMFAPISFMSNLCDFDGKKLNCNLFRLSKYISSEDYHKAINLIDEMLVDSTYNQEDLMRRLEFYVQIGSDRKIVNKPYEWVVKQVEYLKYIAYNKLDRKDAKIHYAYAFGLEYLIKRSIEEGKSIPERLIQTPMVGKPDYSLRSSKLQPKPSSKGEMKNKASKNKKIKK